MTNLLDIYKYINDNIYGSIPVTKLEYDIINTNSFQRLRNIKQLGLANLVFPTAEHTRFSHSIGVMHIIGRMADHLAEKGILDNTDIKKLRLAGLLHDIGHYPLSHLGEKVYMYQKPIRELKSGVTDVNQTQNTLLLVSGKSVTEEAHHENLGKFVIQNRKEIVDILSREVDPKEIAQIIRAEHTNLIYGQLIHSGLDADRLDYLLRDSDQTGVKYGLVDLDYLIRNLSIGRDEKGVNWLGIEKRAIHSAEHFLMARYFSYSQVTWHKTIRGFETLAQALFLEMRQNGFVYENYEAIKEIVNTKDWLNFTDAYFYQNLSEFCKNTDSDYCKTLINSLENRRRIKLIGEEREFRGKDLQKNPRYLALYNLLHSKFPELKKLINKYGFDESLLFHQELTLKIDKIMESSIVDDIADEDLKESIMLIDDGEAYPISLDSSSIIKPLRENKLYCLRCYVVDPKPEQDKDQSDVFFEGFISEFKQLYETEKRELEKKVVYNLSH